MSDLDTTPNPGFGSHHIEPSAGKSWSFGFVSPRRLGHVVAALLVLVIVLDVATIVLLQSRIAVVDRVRSGAGFTLTELEAADHRVSVALLTSVGGLVVTAVVFIWWFRRVYGNVVALGARGLRFGLGWSVGAWFVPFLNLVRPYQIARDSWQASDPDLDPTEGSEWRAGSLAAIVNVWWSVFIVNGIFDRIASRLPTDTADELIRSDRLLMASNALDIVAAALAILFVLRLTSRQQARADRLAATSV